MARSRTRTFLAVDGGPAMRAGVADLQGELARLAPGAKWVPEANLHVTLLFLGEVDERDLIGVCRAAAKVAAAEPAFVLRVGGVGAFPSVRRPKVVWAGVTDGAAELTRLHEKLEASMEDLGGHRREERGYTPHLTLGRVTDDAEGELLAGELPRRRAWAGGQALIKELLVMGSELRREGPEYAVLARAPLAAAEVR